MADPVSTTEFETFDHIGRAFRRLLSQYRSKPRIVAFVRALARAANVCEEELFSVLISFDIDNANRNRLEIWGSLVGEQRGGLTDDEYRRFIKARMLVNTSNGTPDELIRILETVTYPSEVSYRDCFPACYMITALRGTPMSDIVARRVGRLMIQAKPAGIGCIVIEAVSPAFGFAGDADAGGYDEGLFSRTITVG